MYDIAGCKIQWDKMPTIGATLIFVAFLVIPCKAGQATECSTNITSLFSELENEVQRREDSMTASDIYHVVSEWVPLSPRNVTEQCLHQGVNATQCLLDKCLTFHEILRLHNLNATSSLSQDDLHKLSPLLTYIVRAKSCNNADTSVEEETEERHRNKPTMAKAWGYGFLFVTIINICSLTGAMVLPFMKKSVYKQILIFMIGLAVGCLAANGLLVLIPEALGLMFIEGHEVSWNYVWKTTTVLGGIYLFFLIERFLKMILDWNERRNEDYLSDEPIDDQDMYSSIKAKTPITTAQRYKDTKNLPTSLPTSASEIPLTDENSQDNVLSIIEITPQNGNTKSHANKPIATVAWMIIFGDGMHNFIDGLSIGAAFTESILAGISISLAIICEELPHELGDFAILINAGMSMKKALMYNFLSACMCYLGLIVGMLLGENTHAHDWIFAIAGGMFLYISLVDMMPEMNSEAENEENKRIIGVVRIFVLQNLGMILGFAVILMMTLYSGDINFE
ncbi:metal cation symporter ZIP14-like [Ylistrum balloti]|uniref:metal cation symporter ZIP14-like n=1 Tax=Ylistrum balloti TaxID=509963 RepID=UPI002905E3BD|nr:metal cation symporter ZIP14-like [Ylistrum balloti]